MPMQMRYGNLPWPREDAGAGLLLGYHHLQAVPNIKTCDNLTIKTVHPMLVSDTQLPKPSIIPNKEPPDNLTIKTIHPMLVSANRLPSPSSSI